jgi:hypothetical protein
MLKTHTYVGGMSFPKCVGVKNVGVQTGQKEFMIAEVALFDRRLKREVNLQRNHTVCGYCKRTATDGKWFGCTGCKGYASYCQPSCQRNHHSTHVHECIHAAQLFVAYSWRGAQGVLKLEYRDQQM